MTIGSLFSGVGGFDLAFERAGFETRWAVEIDDRARSVFARHFPNAQLFTDVRNVGAHNLEPVDIIVGGFPCQDLSVAGKRAGLDGERSGLFYELARIVAELSPDWLCLENVPGLLSSNGGRDMGAVVGTLADLGYGVCWRVLDARYFGVPQRRRRVFIVGHLGGVCPPEILFEPEGLRGDTAAGEEAREGVAGTPGSGIAGCVSSKWAKGTGGPAGDECYNLVACPDAAHAMRPPAGGVDECFRYQNEQSGIVSDTVTATVRRESATTDERSVPAYIIGTLQASGAGTGDHNNRVTDYTTILHTPMTVRRLTPLECERLQGFPDFWTDGQADSARYKQMGNAVAVPVVEWIARRLREEMER